MSSIQKYINSILVITSYSKSSKTFLFHIIILHNILHSIHSPNLLPDFKISIHYHFYSLGFKIFIYQDSFWPWTQNLNQYSFLLWKGKQSVLFARFGSVEKTTTKIVCHYCKAIRCSFQLKNKYQVHHAKNLLEYHKNKSHTYVHCHLLQH